MIFKLKNLHKFFFTYICPTFYGGSPPPAPSTTTQNQNVNSIPGELMPFALGNLQAAKKQLFTTDSTGKITGYQPYTPYSTDANKYVAGFSGMQNQAQQGAAGLQMPGQIGAATGIAGASSLGALGAGSQYAQQATDPNSISAYMSPYMQNVTDYQTQQANRQFDITGAQQMSNATRAGAFGGSREAIMAAENERNRNQAITGIQATGAQNAFQNAQSAQQFGANLGLQGYQAGIQGAQALGNLGEQQLGMETGILNTQNQYGAEQQAREQALINQNVKTWENQQNQPYRAMDVMSGLIRGTPINTSSTTQTTSVANPSYAQQIGGVLGTAGSLYGAYKGKANGGIVQAYAGGGVTETVESSMEAKLRDMSPEQLRAYLPSITSQEELNIAKMILVEEVPQMAVGGIVGYANGDLVDSLSGSMKLPESSAYAQRNKKIQEETNRQIEIDRKKMELAREKAVIEASKKDELAHQTYEERNAKIQEEANKDESSLGDKLKSIKDWATTPIIGSGKKENKETPPTGITSIPEKTEQPEEPTGIAAAQKESTPPVASTANLPGSVMEQQANKINLAKSAEATGIKGAAPEGKVYPQEISKVYREKGLDLPVQSTAYQPSEEPTVQQTPEDDGLSEQRATAAKTPLQIMEEQNAEREKAGIKSPDQISAEQRKEIMAEKSNIGEESKRQMYLRMAEFFSNWGSTPGLPLVAGLKAMKDTIPGVMSDSKEDHAAYKAVNKSLRDLEHATELEKAGHFDKAYAIKEQASATVLKHKEKVAEWAHEQWKVSEQINAQKQIAQIGAGASMYKTDEYANRATNDTGKNYNASPDIASLRDIRDELKGLDAKIEDVTGSKAPEDVAKLEELKGVKKELLDEKIRLKKRMDSRGMSDYSPIQTPSIRTNKDLSKMSQEERFAQQSKLGK